MKTLGGIRQKLEAGGVCILPTETVYGLAARADHTAAIKRIYAIKGRGFDKPLAVCVRDITQAKSLAEFSPLAERLAQAFWPGPLTLVLPAISQNLNAHCYQGETIALRCPDITWRETLLAAPLALTSANRSGAPDAVTAQTEINAEVDAVLDGGPSAQGEASTIIKILGNHAVVLRNGALKPAQYAIFGIK